MVPPVTNPARNIGSSEIRRELFFHCSDSGKVVSVDGDEVGSVDGDEVGSVDGDEVGGEYGW